MTNGNEKFWQLEAMVSPKHEYCEIVTMSQWKIELLATVLQGS